MSISLSTPYTKSTQQDEIINIYTKVTEVLTVLVTVKNSTDKQSDSRRKNKFLK